MAEFKIGDKVRCISAESPSFYKKVGTVENIVPFVKYDGETTLFYLVDFGTNDKEYLRMPEYYLALEEEECGMPKFKVGDHVVVKEKVEPEGFYGGKDFNEDMNEFKGKILTISEVLSDGYHLEEDPVEWIWTDEMLDLASYIPPSQLGKPVAKAKNSECSKKKDILFGVAPDVPVVTNEQGGKQSDTPYGFHMLPANALFRTAQTAQYGAKKYGETFDNRNYTKISSVDHINHALQHLYAHLAGDQQDDHLAHAALRCLFALETCMREQEKIQDNTQETEVKE